MTALARGVLGISVLLFLTVGDVWFPPDSPWLAVRLPILAIAAVAALLLAALRPSLLRPAFRPPMVFFMAFAAADIVSSALAAHPLSCLRYAVGYFAVALVAAAVAGMFSNRALLRGLLATLVAKVVISVAFASCAFAWTDGPRLQGVLGSPNPMGAAAGLAYLLLMLHGWYDWPTAAVRRLLVVAIALTATIALAFTQSSSAVVATVSALLIVAPLGRLRREGWKQRWAWIAIAGALLAPVVLVSCGAAGPSSGRLAPPGTALGLRLRWWSMLVPVVLRQPWLGYGAGPLSFNLPGQPPWGTSAHNLYLEAAIYAGIPAAAVLLLFVATAVLRGGWLVLRDAEADTAGLAAVLVFYAALSVAEPVILNGAPSSLVVPLIAASVCGRCLDGGRESRR